MGLCSMQREDESRARDTFLLRWLLCLALTQFFASPLRSMDAVWGGDYFPNTELTSHRGETLRFFDDLIKNKVVVVNFIYTTCSDVCPLETAQLTKVQRILGDRVGRDVHIYSITIDPENDTPEVLAEYRERFGAKWTFFTGDRQEIIALRRKLGLYIEDIQGGPNNHNVNMIIGNQTTGRWMKRSPFENPYVLADQIGNWLHDWKSPQAVKDYANAPELRTISDGERLFRTRCLSCHTVDGSVDQDIGPDLLGVTLRRDRQWLRDWLRAPDLMLRSGDPIATALYDQFNQVAMPNLSLGAQDIDDLLEYIDNQTALAMRSPGRDNTRLVASAAETRRDDQVAVINAWVREAVPNSPVNAGYMTLINLSARDLHVRSVEADKYEAVELHEMAVRDGMMEMRQLEQLTLPAAKRVELKPGGKHLMLMNPRQPLVDGHTVRLTITYTTGRIQTVLLPVVNR